MAHTDKDRPYAVKTQDEGIVHHDHRQGRCVVGTYKQARAYWTYNRKHREVCPRWSSAKVCIHDGERIRLQAVVDHARAAQRSNFRPVYWNSTAPSGAARGQSSDAIRNMLNAGRIPNCIETKTHKIDIADIDLHLIPGESIDGYHSVHRWMRFRQPAILQEHYDRNVRCRECDAREEVTCWVEIPSADQRHSRYYCGCWNCEYDDERTENRRERRDTNRKRVREYNTFRETE